jgi:MarR family transcriptional regulator, negative regulator of the multidrug operon emrRAB
VTESRDSHLVNTLGAFALALADRMRDATEAAVQMTGAGPAALVALQQFLAGRTTEELSQAVGLTHSGAVRLVDRFVDAGLVDRRPGRDGRSSAIVLTASGRAAARRIGAARAAAIGAALAQLNARDRRALSPLIDTLIETLTNQRLDARIAGGESPAWLCRLCDFGSCGRPDGECPAANAARGHHSPSDDPVSFS